MDMKIFIRKKSTFGLDKIILKISRTNVEFILLIQKIFNSLSKRLRLVVLAYAAAL